MDRASIDDMARLMRLTAGVAEPEATPEPVRRAAVEAARPKGDPEVAAMRVILERLQQASATVVDRLLEEADSDRELGEALVTERTALGARIGTWEICLHEADDGRRYDVVNTATGEPIAKDLFLYEAAYGLAKHLNQGVTVNDRRVRNLLQIEEDFVRHRADAITLKRRRDRLSRDGDSVAAAVAEDRYDEAKRRAVLARQRLQELSGIR